MATTSRFLAWDGCFNARDLGGPGRLAPGALVRADRLDALTGRGRTWLKTVRVPLDGIGHRDLRDVWWDTPGSGTPACFRPFPERFPDRAAAAARQTGGMSDTYVRLVHTGQLGPEDLAAVRALLDGAFEGDFGDEDFEHALGGMHALVYEEGEPVAHGSVVQRRVLHGGRALRAGYVEAVAVRADRRRRGLGGEVMAALETVIGRAYVLGALSASEAGAALYTGRGWRPYPGRIGVLGPDGPVRLAEEEGSTFVWTPPGGIPPDPAGRLDFDWRDGDVL